MKRNLIISCFALYICQAYSQTSTEFGQCAGIYKELYDATKSLLLNATEAGKVKPGGKQRTQFVSWIRNNVHVMKAMKYLEKDSSCFWNFFMETQTLEGLYFDYFGAAG